MDKQNYKPRVIDAKVKEYLSAFGAVCIEGPKWCGKTWTSSYHSKSEIYIVILPITSKPPDSGAVSCLGAGGRYAAPD